MDRREFIKSSAVAAACGAAGIASPASAAKNAEAGWRWDKAVCRFCGTGCGIMVEIGRASCRERV